jgi:hypothetical protein
MEVGLCGRDIIDHSKKAILCFYFPPGLEGSLEELDDFAESGVCALTEAAWAPLGSVIVRTSVSFILKWPSIS